MIKMIDLLNEGTYDPGIFKAVFMSGGPGSGKSFAANSLFGMPESTVSSDGLKGVNSDSAFELIMAKHNIDLDMTKLSAKEYAKSQQIRKSAKSITSSRLKHYLNGKLGLLIDGTGKDYNKIAAQVKMLKKQGYDCYMTFINTTLEVALSRNESRPRRVPVELVNRSWKECQANLKKYKTLFGDKNFISIDNSVKADFSKSIKQTASKFVRRPIQNKIAQSWIDAELELRNTK